MKYLLAPLITVFAELPVLYLFGYKSRIFMIFAAAVNVFSNIAMNLALACFSPSVFVTVTAEAAVVVFEYLMFSVLLGLRRRLFCAVAAANAASVALGLIIFKLF